MFLTCFGTRKASSSHFQSYGRLMYNACHQKNVHLCSLIYILFMFGISLQFLYVVFCIKKSILADYKLLHFQVSELFH